MVQARRRSSAVAAVPSLTLGTLLRRYRLAAGLTQEELAAQAGLSRRGIADLELGTRTRPRKETLHLLAEALHLSPQERALLEAAARGRRAPTVPANPPSRSVLTSAVPLVGRAQELRLLERHLADGPPLFLVAGEPGIGKSRLLQAGRERAEVQGWTVLMGGCHRRSGQEPYAPFIGALTDSLHRQTLTEQRMHLEGCTWLVRLLPELAEGHGIALPTWTLPAEQERRLMFIAVARYLANMSGPAGTLLMLDDLHWAGPDALDLLHFLVTFPSERPLRLLGAFRDTDVDPKAPLMLLVADLTREGRTSRALLAPLAKAESAALLDELLPEAGSEEGQVRQQVLERAGGVPLFLISCTQALSTGSLTRNGISHVPWTLREAILQRAVALSEDAQQVLRAAAVIGRYVPRALLFRVTTRSALTEELVLEALEECERARLLVETNTDTYQLTHDLIREVVVTDLGAGRRALLHRRVAEALEQQPGSAPLEVLAYHYVQSGEVEKAIFYLERTGDAAQARYAYTEALQVYQQAVARLDKLERGTEAALIRMKVGQLLTTLTRYDEALGVLNAAEEAFRLAGNLEGRLLTLAKIGIIHRWQGTSQAGLTRLLALLERFPTLAPSPGAAAYYMTLATLYLRTIQFDEQLAAAERAIALARALDDVQTLPAAQERQGMALLMLGRAEEAYQILTKEVLPVTEATGDALTLLYALRTLVGVYIWWGQGRQAQEYGHRAFRLAEQLGNQAELLFSLVQYASVTITLGEWKEAHTALERAIAITPSVPLFAYHWISLGRLCLAEGEEETASQHFTEALRQAEQGHDLRALRSAQKMLAEHELFLGRPKAAHARLAPFLEGPNAQIRDVDATDLLVTMAWAYIELGEVARAHQMLVPFLAQTRQAQSRQSLAGALLVQARAFMREERWQEAEQALTEALELYQAMPFPYAEAQTLYLFGQMSLQQGAPDLARERFRSARTILEKLGERLYARRIEQMLAKLAPTPPQE
jgi:tetratricopeptide (TPR) repeat protein/transcriptional regulator with XRE-family HTH domain